MRWPPGRTRVAIADDEPLARANLRLSLAARPDVEIVGEAANGADAISLVKETRPDALFLDVRMPAGDAFTVMRDLPAEPPLVIFLTAYEEYALGAFDVRAFDYLVKPCDDQRFTACMERIVATTIERRAARAVARLRTLLGPGDVADPKADQSRLQVRQGGRTYLVPVSSIRWIDVRGTVIRLHTHETTYTARSGLARLIAELGPTRFARIHRHAAVNIDCVSELDTQASGEPIVVLTSGERLRASRRQWQRLHDSLANPPAAPSPDRRSPPVSRGSSSPRPPRRA